MSREVRNPNTTDKPLEVTRFEVSVHAKTGCRSCNGAGCVSYAAKAERGQLVATPKWSICRCVHAKFLRPDIREIDGRMHWMPAGQTEAEYVTMMAALHAARPHDEDKSGPARITAPEDVCGFGWRNEKGDVRRCGLAHHTLDVDHLDAGSGARTAQRPKWVCTVACGAGSDAVECPATCWLCGGAMVAPRVPSHIVVVRAPRTEEQPA